ncbi:MAG: DNA repair protein RadA [Gammaproteobacteria bacterium]|nr:DNA repair protein RadA [Gammaproteobacteria bacterium]MDX2460998.1 DNA repair protein RadA [Gammaproteobacteria bacterium]
MALREKHVYQCQSCGAQASKWSGQCADCGEWNTLLESVAPRRAARAGQLRGVDESLARIVDADEVAADAEGHRPLGIGELDRALGGGLVPGSVVLIGGDPGIGKSTLLLQAMAGDAKDQRPLYVTGEESLRQVTLRAQRLGLRTERLRLLAETHVEQILALAARERPTVMVIDSIQTMYTDTLQSAPGSVAQIRDSAARLVQFAKKGDTAVILIGHVTKEGAIAGPRVLEHMVDAVLYFESESDSRYRVIRAVKNRFGAANELGFFAMTERGLREVSNPSAIFLSRGDSNVAGSTVTVVREGTRMLLLEIQALVDTTQLAHPRRVAVGSDANRMGMLLAALHRHAGIATQDQDVFVNVVGGMRIAETGADLPLLLAVVSSLNARPVAADLVVFGEVGLAGEIRPVAYGEERLAEAAKHGFKRAIVPTANKPRRSIAGIEVTSAAHLGDALALV